MNGKFSFTKDFTLRESFFNTTCDFRCGGCMLENKKSELHNGNVPGMPVYMAVCECVNCGTINAFKFGSTQIVIMNNELR